MIAIATTLLRALRLAPSAALPAAAAGIALAPGTASAQTVAVSPGVWATRVPVQHTAPATASGEAVLFTGAGTITTRISTDPLTGHRSFNALFNMTGIVGVGVLTGTRYVLDSYETLVLPLASTQRVVFGFPMEPTPESPNQALRTAEATLIFYMNAATGAIAGLGAGSIRLD